MPNDYHHGDLPTALRGAAVELLAERGPASFSLREVARRAGVSHAAPSHHFGDSAGLLSSVAAEGYRFLASEMRSAVEGIDEPVERLKACGRAYVRTARANPGHYAVMIDHDYTSTDHDELTEAGAEAYAVLLETVEFLRVTLKPDLDVAAMATLLWAGVHGLVELHPNLEHLPEEKMLANPPSLDLLVDTWSTMLIEGIRKREN